MDAIPQTTPYTDAALVAALNRALPRTEIVAVKPSEMPGMRLVQMSNGKTAYVTPDGRYLVMGVAFDLQQRRALDGALTGSKHVE